MAHLHQAHPGIDGHEHDHGPDQSPPGAVAWEGESRGPAWVRPALVGAGLLAASAYTYAFDPNQPGHFPLCPLKYATGIDCPACGGLRGVHALLHGDVAGAADHNVLLLAFLPVAAVGWLLWMLRSTGVDAPRIAIGRRFAVAAIAVAVAFMVVRNLGWFPGHDFLNSAAS